MLRGLKFPKSLGPETKKHQAKSSQSTPGGKNGPVNQLAQFPKGERADSKSNSKPDISNGKSPFFPLINLTNKQR